MSIERRMGLLEAMDGSQASLQSIVTTRASIIAGNWDLAAYAYQQGFEALWDHAVARTTSADAARSSSLVVLPLLMIWRQSVELSIKAAIGGTTGRKPPPGHILTDLFDELLAERAARGDVGSDDDDYTDDVKRLIVEFQELDARADRWRYPTDLKGLVHEGVSVDLDRLFQAHAKITGWCDGAGIEAEQVNIHGSGHGAAESGILSDEASPSGAQ